MPVEIVVPRLGWSMEEGTFGQWLVQEGQRVERGQPLFVLEGEKAAQDVEAIDSGVLCWLPNGPQPGDTVAVGQVIGYFVEEAEPAPFQPQAVQRADAPRAAHTGHATDRAGLPAGASETAGSNPDTASIKASPRARRRALQLGVDLQTLRGTGAAGRIRERDVLAAASALGAARAPSAAQPALEGAAPQEPGQLVPLSDLRAAIARNMLRAAQSTAPVTLTARCNATNLVNLRAQFRAAAAALGSPPGYTDFVVKLAACALAQHPLMKAQWTSQGLFVPAACHIAVAVDTERGLLAPVIRHVERLTLRQVSAELASLAHQARQGSLSVEQLQSGVLTVTNLGMFGIESFTPLPNPPQCATLGMGRISQEPAFEAGQCVPRDSMMLSLTFDHRVVDGAPAARFLQTLVQAIENPGAYLV